MSEAGPRPASRALIACMAAAPCVVAGAFAAMAANASGTQTVWPLFLWVALPPMLPLYALIVWADRRYVRNAR